MKNGSILSEFSPPSHGKEYTKRETFDMLSKFNDGSSERSALIDELTINGLVPQSRGSIFRLLKKHAKGELDIGEPWRKRGQPKLLTDNDIASVKEDLFRHSAKSIGDEDLIKKMRQSKKAKIEKANLVPLTIDNFNPSAMTLTNYKAMIISSCPNSTTTVGT